MKDITDILKEFNSKYSMEFCDDFAKIQGVVNYCNDYIKPLNKIQFRGGNGPYILELTSRLLRVLHNCGYITDDHKPKPEADIPLRKITFFLILNTDTTFKYDLNHDLNVCHLLNSMPQLTKCLLMCCIWSLKLEQYFYEMIKYSPGWFSLQFLDCAIENIKDLKPYEVLVCVESLVKSVYINIARSDYQIINNVEKKISLGKYLDVMMELLRHFFSPDAEKFTDWKKLQYYKYFGFVLKHIVDIIKFCFETYQTKPICDIPEKYKLFYLMSEKEKMIDNCSKIYSETVNEILTQINILLLNSLQTNVEKLTLDIFLYMVEIDVDDENTLQKYVGESLYNIQEILLKNQWFEHEIVKRLESVAIRPKLLHETIKESTLGNLMLKMKKYSNSEDKNIRSIYMKEFLERGEMVLDNIECLESIEENLDILTFNDLIICINFLRNEEIDYEQYIKEIILKSFKYQTDENIIQLILYIIKQFGQDTDCLELETFNVESVEFFNKFVADDKNEINIKKYFYIIAQNPSVFIRMMFDFSLKNEAQKKYVIDLFIKTKDLIEEYLENELNNLFEKNFENTPENELNLISILLSDLFLIEILSKDDYLNILYNHILKSLKENKYTLLLILIKSILLMSKKTEFDNITTPVLIMAGQVMDQCRWDIVRYTDELDEILTISIALVQNITKRYIGIVSDHDKNWIKTKSQMFKPLTKYYFQKYFLQKNEEPKYFAEFLHPLPFSNDKHEIIGFLCEIFVRCTSKETEWLVKNAQLEENLMDTILVLSAIVSKTTIRNSVNCLRNCVLNYAKILKIQILPKKSSQEKLQLLKELCNVVSKMPEEIYESIFTCLQPVIAEIIETSLPENIAEKENIYTKISDLNDAEGKEFLLNKINLI